MRLVLALERLLFWVESFILYCNWNYKSLTLSIKQSTSCVRKLLISFGDKFDIFHSISARCTCKPRYTVVIWPLESISDVRIVSMIQVVIFGWTSR
jgi:hypothetical protein